MKKVFLASALMLAAFAGQAQSWTSLFNGKDLTGWHQATGEGEFTVENGVISGTTHKMGGINSFLVTDESYSDFILEFQFKMEDGAGNSGIQLRSHMAPNGRVSGFQFEMDDNNNRGFTGGLMYEAGYGWAYKLTYNRPASKACKPGKWNKARVEVIGNSYRTFVNGVECANLISDIDKEGFLGLQVHAVKKESPLGKTVQWRNIRICTKDVEKYATPVNKDVHQVNWLNNELTAAQRADGWRLLFNGKDLDGWLTINNLGGSYGNWSVNNGILSVNNPNRPKSDVDRTCIYTKEKFENFWLSVEFRIGSGVNSGIKYFINPGALGRGNDSVGFEYQVLDDVKHPDAKMGKNGNRTLGSLYDMIPSDKTDLWFNLGQWNTAWIIVRGNHVEHYLNGAKIVEYDKDSEEFKKAVSESKFNKYEGFGTFDSGHILLQDHHDFAEYRNVMIKKL